jgi:hypothetical protein
MPKHTDRGLIVVHDEADGTTSLAICAKVVDGKPTNVYARYYHAPHLQIAPDVELTTHGRARYTEEIVEVASRNGVVTVRYPRYNEQR